MLYRVEQEFHIPSDLPRRPIDRRTLDAFGVEDDQENKAGLTKLMIRGQDINSEWDVQVRGHHDDGHRVLGRIICQQGVNRPSVLPITRDWLQAVGCEVSDILEQAVAPEEMLVVVRGITIAQMKPAILPTQQI